MEDIKLIERSTHRDKRGDLWTLWNQNDPETAHLNFNHDKVSVSKRNVLRGIHGDFKSWKLISCIYGKIFFVVVDNRKNSKTYFSYNSFELNGDVKKSILLPPGFGNGFYVQSDYCVFHYKWSYEGEYPDVEDQFTLKWNNKDLSINWPCTDPILQLRDS